MEQTEEKERLNPPLWFDVQSGAFIHLLINAILRKKAEMHDLNRLIQVFSNIQYWIELFKFSLHC